MHYRPPVPPIGGNARASSALWCSLTRRCYADAVSKDDRTPFFVEWMQAGLALLADSDHPKTLADAAAVAKRAWARAALKSTEGNILRAADLVGVHRRTLLRAALDNSVTTPSNPWHDGAVHLPFDDQLFPFVRTLWPATPDPAWVQDYGAWLIEAIVPRAVTESTKIVICENCSTLSSLPSMSVLTALGNLQNTLVPIAEPHSAGAVFFAPTLPLGSWIAPVINLAPKPVKLATTPNKIFSLATTLFEDAGVPVPPNLSLD